MRDRYGQLATIVGSISCPVSAHPSCPPNAPSYHPSIHILNPAVAKEVIREARNGVNQDEGPSPGSIKAGRNPDDAIQLPSVLRHFRFRRVSHPKPGNLHFGQLSLNPPSTPSPPPPSSPTGSSQERWRRTLSSLVSWAHGPLPHA